VRVRKSGRLPSRIRKPFVSKIDFKKILAKRCTDPVRIENPGTRTKDATRICARKEVWEASVQDSKTFCV